MHNNHCHRAIAHLQFIIIIIIIIIISIRPREDKHATLTADKTILNVASIDWAYMLNRI